MWSATHFPSAMRSLNPTTRAKAIEIANQLLEQGQVDKHYAAVMGIDGARHWARCQHARSLTTTQPYSSFATI